MLFKYTGLAMPISVLVLVLAAGMVGSEDMNTATHPQINMPYYHPMQTLHYSRVFRCKQANSNVARPKAIALLFYGGYSMYICTVYLSLSN